MSDLNLRIAISIHALREEGDPEGRQSIGHNVDFYPRPPRGGRCAQGSGRAAERNFYPRPPRGGRLKPVKLKGNTIEFLSTPSARRATIFIRSGMALLLFLSTPSARRATRFPAALPAITRDFYPRPPRGGRPMSSSFFSSVMEFLSTPSARRATRGLSGTIRMTIFLSTPSARRAT